MYPRISIAVRAIVSIIQLIGGLIGLWILFGIGDGNIAGPGFWFFLIFVGSIAGAFLLWRSPYLGILLSLAVQAAQIPLIDTPELGYRLAVGVGLWFKTAPLHFARYAFGTNFSYSHASGWGTGAPTGPSSYGINVAAMILFFLLLALLWMRKANLANQPNSIAQTPAHSV